MNYFEIGDSIDSKIIGHYPQTKLKRGYTRMHPHQFPDFVPDYELILHDKAYKTNKIYRAGASFGMIIDSKFREVISKFKLPKHHFYPVKVHHKNAILQYFWLHFIVDDFWEYLDKDKSYGAVENIQDIRNIVVEKKIPILSNDQIISEESKYKIPLRLMIGELVMKKGFPNYDLYQTRAINYRTMISEKLKNALLAEGLTGFELKPFPKFSVEE